MRTDRRVSSRGGLGGDIWFGVLPSGGALVVRGRPHFWRRRGSGFLRRVILCPDAWSKSRRRRNPINQISAAKGDRRND
jgi:hypothetical protein